jgi:hypothetical protein
MRLRAAFKRMLLGVHQSAPDSAAVGIAAEFARLLRLDMMAVIIEEPQIAGLSALPHAREFRLLSRRWQPLDRELMARELELSVIAARRLLSGVAASHRISCAFEVVKASPNQAVRSLSRATDIILLPEPRSALDKIVGPFPQFSVAALQSEAAVMFAPRQSGSSHGPVVAIAATPDDPSIDTAISIAAATNEKIILVAAFADPQAMDQAIGTGAERSLVQEVITVPTWALTDDKSLSSRLGERRERLIVMTRIPANGQNDAMGFALSSARRVPVLLLEPAPTAAGAKGQRS